MFDGLELGRGGGGGQLHRLVVLLLYAAVDPRQDHLVVRSQLQVAVGYGVF